MSWGLSVKLVKRVWIHFKEPLMWGSSKAAGYNETWVVPLCWRKHETAPQTLHCGPSGTQQSAVLTYNQRLRPLWVWSAALRCMASIRIHEKDPPLWLPHGRSTTLFLASINAAASRRASRLSRRFYASLRTRSTQGVIHVTLSHPRLRPAQRRLMTLGPQLTRRRFLQNAPLLSRNPFSPHSPLLIPAKTSTCCGVNPTRVAVVTTSEMDPPGNWWESRNCPKCLQKIKT